MDDRSPPSRPNNYTQLGGAENEMGSFPFLFIKEEGKKADSNSSTRFAVHSHARKHAILERRRRNAPAKRHHQILQRVPDRAHVEASSSGLDVAPTCMMFGRDRVIPIDPLVAVDPLQDALNYQLSDFCKSESSESSCSSDQNVAQQNMHRKVPPGGRKLRTKLKRKQENSLKSPSDQRKPILLQTEESVHIWTTQKSLRQQPPSVQTILSAGRVDPFRTYPTEVDSYEHYLADWYPSVCCQAFPKERETGHSRLLTKWVPLCMTSEMAYKSILLSSETHCRGMSGRFAWSPRALKYVMECCALLREEIDKPNPVISDAMIATVINLSAAELVYNGRCSKYKSHMSGLEQMVKLRGGLDNLGSNGYMKDMVIWINQLGGGFPMPDAQEANVADEGIVLRAEDVSNKACFGPSLISPEMVGIFRSIRHLTITKHTTSNPIPPSSIDHDFQATCFEIQQQLEDLKSKTPVATIEESCIYATHMYIDKVLLNAPVEKLFASPANGHLQKSIIQARSARELEECKDILDWTLTMAVMSLCFDESQRANLVNKFHAMVTRLERFQISCF